MLTEGAVYQVIQLLAGETELFCHDPEQLVAYLFLTMTDPGTDRCIPSIENKRQFDVAGHFRRKSLPLECF